MAAPRPVVQQNDCGNDSLSHSQTVGGSVFVWSTLYSCRSCAQRANQGFDIDDVAPRCIDQNRTVLHLLELVARDEVACRIVSRNVQSDDVGPPNS